MSQEMTLLSSVDVVCPYCEEYNEIWDVNIAVTIEGLDVGRRAGESKFHTVCERCGGDFTVEATGEIMVRKV